MMDEPLTSAMKKITIMSRPSGDSSSTQGQIIRNGAGLCLQVHIEQIKENTMLQLLAH